MTGINPLSLFRAASKPRRGHGQRRTARADAGFSLVEVLVAFSVAGLTLAIYFNVLGRAAAASQLSKDRLTAAAYAQSKLSQLGVVEPVIEGKSHGRFDDEFSWEVLISSDVQSALGRAQAALRPITVRLEVSWKRGRIERRVSYAASRLVPREAQSP